MHPHPARTTDLGQRTEERCGSRCEAHLRERVVVVAVAAVRKVRSLEDPAFMSRHIYGRDCQRDLPRRVDAAYRGVAKTILERLAEGRLALPQRFAAKYEIQQQMGAEAAGEFP